MIQVVTFTYKKNNNIPLNDS